MHVNHLKLVFCFAELLKVLEPRQRRGMSGWNNKMMSLTCFWPDKQVMLTAAEGSRSQPDTRVKVE